MTVDELKEHARFLCAGHCGFCYRINELRDWHGQAMCIECFDLATLALDDMTEWTDLPRFDPFRDVEHALDKT